MKSLVFPCLLTLFSSFFVPFDFVSQDEQLSGVELFPDQKGETKVYQDSSRCVSLELPKDWIRTIYSYDGCYFTDGLHFPKSHCEYLYVSTMTYFAAIMDYEVGVSVKITADISELTLAENEFFSVYESEEGAQKPAFAVREEKLADSLRLVIKEFESLETAEEKATFLHNHTLQEYLSSKGNEMKRTPLKIGAFTGFRSEVQFFRKGELVPDGNYQLYAFTLVHENKAVEIEFRAPKDLWGQYESVFDHAIRSMSLSK